MRHKMSSDECKDIIVSAVDKSKKNNKVLMENKDIEFMISVLNKNIFKKPILEEIFLSKNQYSKNFIDLLIRNKEGGKELNFLKDTIVSLLFSTKPQYGNKIKINNTYIKNQVEDFLIYLQ